MTLLAPVKLHIVLAHEDIAEDPEWAAWNIDAHQANNTSGATLLQDEVLLFQSVVLTTQGKREIRQIFGAIHCPFLSHQTLRAQLLRNRVDIVRWTSEQRCTGVNDGSSG
jgi:ketosteroid isomerase-like protein